MDLILLLLGWKEETRTCIFILNLSGGLIRICTRGNLKVYIAGNVSGGLLTWCIVQNNNPKEQPQRG
ncbi:hypothetical protein GDO86_020376 [Hymenochirus boettgeri]|uniref:Uncharacterized protein n=1 Tax=Hymenochirus boettgeri TaxID=247094 RepID=A0A8T2IJ86_9PIPI|nr:hypothetical protein GDO86_020376 [Hymenochirus boettgeri]